MIQQLPYLLDINVASREGGLQVMVQCEVDSHTEPVRHTNAVNRQKSSQGPVFPIERTVERARVLQCRFQEDSYNLLLLITKQETQGAALVSKVPVDGANQVRHVFLLKQLDDLRFHFRVRVGTLIGTHTSANVVVSQMHHAIAKQGAFLC